MKTEMTHEEKITLKTYQKMAEARNNYYGPKPFDPHFWKGAFDTFKKLLPQGRILEIGCGNGRDAQFFCEDPDYYYFGIDACPEMIYEAQKAVPRAPFRVMNLYTLDIPHKSFDGFWAVSVYLHVPKKNLYRALIETKKVIRPGGTGCIIMREGEGETMIPGEEPEWERFYALYSDSAFSLMLRIAGFEILKKEKDTRNKPELIYFVRA